MPATGTTNKENQAKVANGPQHMRQYGRAITFQQWSGHQQHLKMEA